MIPEIQNVTAQFLSLESRIKPITSGATAAPMLPIMFILPESVPAYSAPTSMQVLQLPGIVRSLQKLADPMASMASNGSPM